MEINNNTHFLPAPPGLVAHSKDSNGGTWTEPIIGFVSRDGSIEPLILGSEGIVEEWSVSETMVAELHVDGPGLSMGCPWGDA